MDLSLLSYAPRHFEQTGVVRRPPNGRELGRAPWLWVVESRLQHDLPAKSSQYSLLRPTTLDKIKNFRITLQVGAVTDACLAPASARRETAN